MVASLRAAMNSGADRTVQAVAGRLEALETAVSRVLAEHSGMAEELLRAYEQLGIVFDVTRQLPTVRTEREVLYLFVQSLRTTYPNTLVAVAEENADGEFDRCRAGMTLPAWVAAALVDCRDQRRVVVADCPDSGSDTDSPVPGGCRQLRRGDRPILRVMCGPIFAGDDFACALLLGQDDAVERDAITRAFDASEMSLLDSLNLFCGDLIRNFRLVDQLRQLSVDVVRALISAVEQKDEYTSGHSARVGVLAVLLGRAVGLDAAELQMLEWSALLHDIGKIGIRDDVLKKPGRLTEDEFRHIQEHPSRSYSVVRQVPQLAAALDGVLHHHEHWDGGGYPEGLSGEAIPLQARIIQVADIFDALTSTRSYRQPFDWSKALDILREEAGKTADPKLVGCFDRLIHRMVRDEPQHLQEIMSIDRHGPTEDLGHPATTPSTGIRKGGA